MDQVAGLEAELARLRARPGADPVEIAAVRGRLGRALLLQERPAEAMALLEIALSTLRALVPGSEDRLLGEIALVHALRARGELAAADRSAGAALADLEQGRSPDDPGLLALRESLARCRLDAGDLAEARRGFALVAAATHDAQVRARTTRRLAEIALADGEGVDAALREALASAVAAGVADDTPLFVAAALQERGRPEDAGAVLAEAVARLRSRRGGDDPATIEAELHLLIARRRTGRLVDAFTMASELDPRARRALGASHPTSVRITNQLGLCEQRLGLPTAGDRFADALARAEADPSADPEDVRTLRLNLGAWLVEEGRLDEGLALYRHEADLELAEETPRPGRLYLDALADAGRWAERAEWLESALAGGRLRGARCATTRAALAATWWEVGRRDDALAAWRVAQAEASAADPSSAETFRLLLVLVDAHRQLGRPADTRELLSEALLNARHRGDAEGEGVALRLLAEAAHADGDAAAAAEALGALRDRLGRGFGEHDARALAAAVGAELARAHAAPEHLDTAAARLEALGTETSLVFDLHPLDVLARRALAEVEHLRGDEELALSHATDALADAREILGDAAPLTRAALLTYALRALSAGHRDAATAALTAHVQGAADDQSPDVTLARMTLHQLGERAPTSSGVSDDGRSAEARAALATWIRDEGDDAPQAVAARLELAKGLRSAGRTAEAAEELARLREEHAAAGREEEAVAAWNLLAMVLEEHGSDEEAEAEFAAALAAAETTLGPDAPLTLSLRHNLADTLERRGDYDGAAWWWGRNVLLLGGPDDDGGPALNARRRLAWTLVLSGRTQQALLVARRALADGEALLTPGAEATLDARNTVAFCLSQLGDDDGARELFEHNLVEAESALGHDSAVVLPYRNNLARHYLADGRTDEALALYRASADVVRPALAAGEARDAEVLRHLAECLARTDHHDEAAAVFDEYVDAVVASDGVESARAHRARAAWAAELVVSGADDQAFPAALGDPAEAHRRAALLTARGDATGAAAVRVRHNLADPPADEDAELGGVRARVGEALLLADEVLAQAGDGDGTSLYGDIHAQTTGLAPDDPARVTSCLALAFALVDAGRGDEALALVGAELELLARRDAWGGRGARMLVAFLRARYLERRRWDRHDDLLARDVAELARTLGWADPRTVVASSMLAGALRRRGEVTAAAAVLDRVASAQGARPAGSGEGAEAVLAVARTRVSQRLAADASGGDRD